MKKYITLDEIMKHQLWNIEIKPPIKLWYKIKKQLNKKIINHERK